MSNELIGQNGYPVGSGDYFKKINEDSLLGKLSDSTLVSDYGKILDALCTRTQKAIMDIHSDLAKYVASLRFIKKENREALIDAVTGFKGLFNLGSHQFVHKADSTISMLKLDAAKSKQCSNERQSTIDAAVKIVRNGGKISLGKSDRFRVMKKALDYGVKNLTNAKDKEFYLEVTGNKPIEFAKDVYLQAHFQEYQRDYVGKCNKIICSSDYIYSFEKDIFTTKAIDLFKGLSKGEYFDLLYRALSDVHSILEKDLSGSGKITVRDNYTRLKNSTKVLDRILGTSLTKRAEEVHGTYGTYNRIAAVNYVIKWHDSHNPEFLAMDTAEEWIKYFLRNGVILGSDCANFVSQALYTGRISMTDDWYFYHVENQSVQIDPNPRIGKLLVDVEGNITNHPTDYIFSGTWTFANDQFLYFSNPQNGYINGQPILIRKKNREDIVNAIRQGVQLGDLLYWDFQNDGRIDHASMITGIQDQDILYGAHSMSRAYGSLYNALSSNESDARAYIIKIRDNAAE